MTKRQETIYLRIPTELASQLYEIAKLAGVPQQTVIKVALATKMWRELKTTSDEHSKRR